jgi:NADH dehydrogenase
MSLERPMEEVFDGQFRRVEQRPRSRPGEMPMHDQRPFWGRRSLPILTIPPEPGLLILIEHMQRLIAEFCELGAPSSAAAHGLVVEDGADHPDFLPTVHLIPQCLQHFPERGAVGVSPMHEARNVRQAYIAILQLFVIQHAYAAAADDLVSIESEVHLFDAVVFGARAKRRLGAGCAPAEQNAFGRLRPLHRAIIHSERMVRVVIVGGGFAGLNAAKVLGGAENVDVVLLDRHNHHLFSPLLYQVAMAGLSPADIAAPIRTMVSGYRNIRVLLAEVARVDSARHVLETDIGDVPYDYLLLCSGATQSYFGHDEWRRFAPSLKTLEDATAIRAKVLLAFEQAERIGAPTTPAANDERRRFLTFVVVGGGPTGVELAGAIGEMSRFTLARDFRSIDASSARVFLIEAGKRILSSFAEDLAARAVRDLENLGVQVWTSSAVTRIDSDGVEIGSERLRAATVVWAAGVQASPLGASLQTAVDRQGRVVVEPDLSVKGQLNTFVAGDLAVFTHQTGAPLPGTAPVAMQQGRYVGRTILADLKGTARKPFHFVDKGQMATIGRSRAITQIGGLKIGGFLAWLVWLAVHIYYLAGFRNRLFVVIQWAWSYLTFGRGARLIVERRSTLND